MWTGKATQIRRVESEDARAAEINQLKRISVFKGQWGAAEEAVEHKEESVGRRWEATDWGLEAP